MDWLLWIAIGLGVALTMLGLYFFSSKRSAEPAPFPLDETMRDTLSHDPLADPLADAVTDDIRQPVRSAFSQPAVSGEPLSHSRREPQFGSPAPTEFDEFGVSPVRLRPQDEAAAARLVPGRQRRAPRFSYNRGVEAHSSGLPEQAGHNEPRLDGEAPAPAAAEQRRAFAVAADAADHAGVRMAEAHRSSSQAMGINEAVANRQDKGERAADAADVIPLYLIARQSTGFAGSRLLDVFARMGFAFGDMDVYHYRDARGYALFSLMNGVAPGTFDPATLSAQSTPALALFLRLPVDRQPGLILEQFLELAYRMADELDARLLDDRREALSTESVDRMRAIVLND